MREYDLQRHSFYAHRFTHHAFMEHHVHFYAIAGRFIHGDVENSVSFSAVNVYNF